VTHEPMTLREAVVWLNDVADDASAYTSRRDLALTAQARAILAAAVEAHEARCVHDDNACIDDFEPLWIGYESAHKRLRALERGEE